MTNNLLFVISPLEKHIFFSILSRPTLQKRVCPRPTDKYFQICQNTFCAFLSIAFAFVGRNMCSKSWWYSKLFFLLYITLRSIKPHYEQLLMMILKMIPLFWLKFYYACFNEKETEWDISFYLLMTCRKSLHNMFPASCDIEAFFRICLFSRKIRENSFGW